MQWIVYILSDILYLLHKFVLQDTVTIYDSHSWQSVPNQAVLAVRSCKCAQAVLEGDDAIVQQAVHVLVATYTEEVELVRECVLRLLVAPEPVYMQKVIYVCDDGHARADGPRKAAMVRQLNMLGVLPCFSWPAYLSPMC
jgi:hypothetical protein